MGIPVLILFAFLWGIPIRRKQKACGQLTKKQLKKALLLGLFPAALLILLADNLGGLLLEMGGNLVLHLQGLDGSFQTTLLYQALLCFLVVALFEERIKLRFARRSLRGCEGLTKADTMVLFGAVGLGYEIAETVVFSFQGGGAVMGVLRGIFLSHVMWQMYMGAAWHDAQKLRESGGANAGREAKKILRRGFLVPYIIHGVNDFLLELAQVLLAEGASGASEGLGVLVFLLVLGLNVFNAVLCMRKFKQAL